eukprot:4356128-Alexandrium_andersonii.AAC.1
MAAGVLPPLGWCSPPRWMCGSPVRRRLRWPCCTCRCVAPALALGLKRAGVCRRSCSAVAPLPM